MGHLVRDLVKMGFTRAFTDSRIQCFKGNR